MLQFSIAIELLSQELYSQGSGDKIICYSSLTVQRMQFIHDSSGDLLMNISNQQPLVLQIDDVDIAFNNTQISCEVEISLPGSEIVTVKKSFIFIVLQSGK